MIVAADVNWCIGKDGNLLTHIPEDMKFFKYITEKRVVVMGRKTQESLPNKTYLKNRINVILSRTERDDLDQYVSTPEAVVRYVSDIDSIPLFIKSINNAKLKYDALSNINYITDSDVFIIGGAQIYKLFLENDLIDTIYLTKIQQAFNGDTFIPNPYDFGFKEVETIVPKKTDDKRNTYTIVKLKK